jgi:hypothetical protein
LKLSNRFFGALAGARFFFGFRPRLLGIGKQWVGTDQVGRSPETILRQAACRCPLCPIKTSTGAGRIRRRTLTLRPLRWVSALCVQRWRPVICSPRPECIERERGLCRLLRKAANRGAGNCVPFLYPSLGVVGSVSEPLCHA